MVSNQLRDQRIIDACQRYRVRELHLFGSAKYGFDSANDVDLLVIFDRDGYQGAFDQFMGLKESLEEILGKRVDLVTAKKFRNPLFQEEVENSKELIYAA